MVTFTLMVTSGTKVSLAPSFVLPYLLLWSRADLFLGSVGVLCCQAYSFGRPGPMLQDEQPMFRM